MKLKMITTANGPKGAFLSGQIYDFSALGLEELGQQFLDGRYAEAIVEAAVEPRGERAVEPKAEAPAATPPDPEADTAVLERWPLKRSGPAEYLERSPDGKHAELAQLYVDAGKPHG